MSATIENELVKLFELKEQRSKAIEDFIIAEAELQGFMQQNVTKEFIEVDDLAITYKLTHPLTRAKAALELANQQFDDKKRFFIGLIEASGCSKLFYNHKEQLHEGSNNLHPYIISVTKNKDGETDLLIHPKTNACKGSDQG